MTLSPADKIIYSLLERPVRIVHVGSLDIDEPPLYKDLVAEGLAMVVGFDAQDDAPVVVGTGKTATLHTCKAPGMTSLLQPNEFTLKKFPYLQLCAEVTDKRKVTPCRLDKLVDLPVDYLAVDVQGAELDVLKSATDLLGSIIAIQVEMPYIRLYKGQPTLGYIDSFLEEHGFEVHMILPPHTNMLSPLLPTPSVPAFNQVVDGDWIYLRTPLTKTELRRLALIAHKAFRSYDLAAACINVVLGQKAAKAYVQALNLQRISPHE